MSWVLARRGVLIAYGFFTKCRADFDPLLVFGRAAVFTRNKVNQETLCVLLKKYPSEYGAPSLISCWPGTKCELPWQCGKPKVLAGIQQGGNVLAMIQTDELANLRTSSGNRR
jgi:hypothetical protein